MLLSLYNHVIIIIRNALQEKDTYIGKRNFAVEQTVAGNHKKVKLQVVF